MYELSSVVIISALALTQSYELFYGLNQTQLFLVWYCNLECRWQNKLPFFKTEGHGRPFFFFDIHEFGCSLRLHGNFEYILVSGTDIGSSSMVLGRDCLSWLTYALCLDSVKTSLLSMSVMSVICEMCSNFWWNN